MKYQKRRMRKRPYRRRRKYRLTRNPARRWDSANTVSGVPKTRIIKMRYCDNIFIQNVAGALNTAAFRANSIFDPNVALGGHQPMGRDFWAQAYKEYCVLGAKITLYCGNDNAEVPVTTGITVNSNTNPLYTETTTYMEAKAGQWVQLMDNRNAKRICTTYSAKKYWNLGDVKDNREEIGAAQTQNPAKQCYFVIWSQPNDRLATTITRYTVVIDYIVSFSDPILQPEN